MLRNAAPLVRSVPATLQSSRTAAIALARRQQTSQQIRSAHAISNPTLANIEKRWEAMPPQEQAELWMALRDRMKVDWNELTLQEKKAAYWVAFGPHGPRALPPPGEGLRVFSYTMIGVVAAGLIFATTRMFAREGPSTMNKEWQEATNEYMRENKIEPISFIGGGDDYKGTKTMVQSPPKKQE